MRRGDRKRQGPARFRGKDEDEDDDEDERAQMTGVAKKKKTNQQQPKKKRKTENAAKAVAVDDDDNYDSDDDDDDDHDDDDDEEEEEEEVYEIDAVLDHRDEESISSGGGRGRGAKRVVTRHFLVSWKGYPASSNSWEPEANVRAPELLAQYWEVDKAKKKKQQQQKKQKKGQARDRDEDEDDDDGDDEGAGEGAAGKAAAVVVASNENEMTVAAAAARPVVDEIWAAQQGSYVFVAVPADVWQSCILPLLAFDDLDRLSLTCRGWRAYFANNKDFWLRKINFLDALWFFDLGIVSPAQQAALDARLLSAHVRQQAKRCGLCCQPAEAQVLPADKATGDDMRTWTQFVPEMLSWICTDCRVFRLAHLKSSRTRTDLKRGKEKYHLERCNFPPHVGGGGYGHVKTFFEYDVVRAAAQTFGGLHRMHDARSRIVGSHLSTLRRGLQLKAPADIINRPEVMFQVRKYILIKHKKSQKVWPAVAACASLWASLHAAFLANHVPEAKERLMVACVARHARGQCSDDEVLECAFRFRLANSLIDDLVKADGRVDAAKSKLCMEQTLQWFVNGKTSMEDIKAKHADMITRAIEQRKRRFRQELSHERVSRDLLLKVVPALQRDVEDFEALRTKETVKFTHVDRGELTLVEHAVVLFRQGWERLLDENALSPGLMPVIEAEFMSKALQGALPVGGDELALVGKRYTAIVTAIRAHAADDALLKCLNSVSLPLDIVESSIDRGLLSSRPHLPIDNPAGIVGELLTKLRDYRSRRLEGELAELRSSQAALIKAAPQLATEFDSFCSGLWTTEPTFVVPGASALQVSMSIYANSVGKTAWQRLLTDNGIGGGELPAVETRLLAFALSNRLQVDELARIGSRYTSIVAGLTAKEGGLLQRVKSELEFGARINIIFLRLRSQNTPAAVVDEIASYRTPPPSPPESEDDDYYGHGYGFGCDCSDCGYGYGYDESDDSNYDYRDYF